MASPPPAPAMSFSTSRRTSSSISSPFSLPPRSPPLPPPPAASPPSAAPPPTRAPSGSSCASAAGASAPASGPGPAPPLLAADPPSRAFTRPSTAGKTLLGSGVVSAPASRVLSSSSGAPPTLSGPESRPRPRQPETDTASSSCPFSGWVSPPAASPFVSSIPAVAWTRWRICWARFRTRRSHPRVSQIPTWCP
ncbi:unnamed protein product [Musa textilis]